MINSETLDAKSESSYVEIKCANPRAEKKYTRNAMIVIIKYKFESLELKTRFRISSNASGDILIAKVESPNFK